MGYVPLTCFAAPSPIPLLACSLARPVHTSVVMLLHSTSRYCACGYPIAIGGHWTGEEYRLLFSDGRDDLSTRADRGPLDHCTQCGEQLDAGDLRFLPPGGTSHTPPARELTHDPH